MKLDELTEDVIGPERAGTMFDLVDRLEPDMPIGELTQYLRW